MDSAEIPAAPAQPAPPGYEACAVDCFPSAQMEFVKAVQERFLAAFADDLGSRLEARITARLESVSLVSRGAFLHSLEPAACLLALETDKVRSQALAAISPTLVAYLLRSLLRGPANAADEHRPVTEIELYILSETFDSLARCMSAAWQPAGVAFGWKPADAAPGAWHGAMLVSECSLNFDHGEEKLRIAVPGFLARVAAAQSAAAPPEETPAPVRESILNALRRAQVSVEAALTDSTLRMGDLLAMEPGHILKLSQPAGTPVKCLIGGKQKFRGEWVRHGDRQALVLL